MLLTIALFVLSNTAALFLGVFLKTFIDEEALVSRARRRRRQTMRWLGALVRWPGAWHKAGYRWPPPPLFAPEAGSGNTTVSLGNRETHICIIDGNGHVEYGLDCIRCTRGAEPVQPSPFVQREIERIEREEAEKKAQNKPHAWNGDMLHIHRFACHRKPNSEELLLQLDVRIGKYFHYMATGGALHDRFVQTGTKDRLWAELIGDFTDWATQPPPNVLCGLPINLHVFTDTDSKLVFVRRGKGVAVGAGQLAAAINENVHPDHDWHSGNHQLDLRALLQRALREELGWADVDDHYHPKKAETHLLLFAVDTACANFGIHGYVLLPTTFGELSRIYAEAGRDRFETHQLIAIDATVRDLCRFIHENNRYNSVGLGAVYSMVHHRDATLAEFEAEFRRIQT